MGPLGMRDSVNGIGKVVGQTRPRSAISPSIVRLLRGSLDEEINASPRPRIHACLVKSDEIFDNYRHLSEQLSYSVRGICTFRHRRWSGRLTAQAFPLEHPLLIGGCGGHPCACRPKWMRCMVVWARLLGRVFFCLGAVLGLWALNIRCYYIDVVTDWTLCWSCEIYVWTGQHIKICMYD